MSWQRWLAAAGVFGGAGALGFVAWKLATTGEHTLKDIEPDAPTSTPGKTGYKLVDKILDKLRAASQSSGIPLGLMVGWVAKESGGKLADTTSLDERGYFQLMPAESKAIGVDHQRLSTDSDYSIDAGVKLIRHYQSAVNDLDVTGAGTSYYWRLVKLAHSMGGGQVKKVVTAAKSAGQAGSWADLESFAEGMSVSGPQPKKWFPFVDLVYKVGRPFGFGSESQAVVGNDFLYDTNKTGLENLFAYAYWDNTRKRGYVGHGGGGHGGGHSRGGRRRNADDGWGLYGPWGWDGDGDDINVEISVDNDGGLILLGAETG